MPYGNAPRHTRTLVAVAACVALLVLVWPSPPPAARRVQVATYGFDRPDVAETRASRSKASSWEPPPTTTTTAATVAPPTTRGSAARSARGAHNAEVTGSNPVPATKQGRTAPLAASSSSSTVKPVSTPGPGALAPYTMPAGCTADGWKSPARIVECWGPLIRRWPWPNFAKVVSVMSRESHGQAHARNPRSTATGLMQELGGSTDPVANMARAWEQSKHGRDWGPWGG